jgi:hypothetical protein
MKRLGLFLIVLVALSAQAPAPKSGAARHLVYQFGYNTAVASSGQGTGTTAVDLQAAPDGGLTVSAADHWWNTVRPRATNTCEVYADGRVNCPQRPYAISPIQLTLFPLLGQTYFKGLSAGTTATWQHTYTVYAAIIPGASGFAGNPTTWKCVYTLHGKGPIPNAGTVLITTTGTLDQQGGTYLKATSKQRIAYDPSAKIPVVVRDTRTHIPMRSVYSNDLVELKLTKDSGWK